MTNKRLSEVKLKDLQYRDFADTLSRAELTKESQISVKRAQTKL